MVPPPLACTDSYWWGTHPLRLRARRHHRAAVPSHAPRHGRDARRLRRRTRLTVAYWVRPHFMTPVTKSFAIDPNGALGLQRGPGGSLQFMASPPSIPNALVVSNSVVNNAGQSPTTAFLRKACTNLPGLNGTPLPAVHVSPGRVAVAPAGNGQQAFQQCISTISDQVPPGGHLPARQPVLGLSDLRDPAVRCRVRSRWPGSVSGGHAGNSAEPDEPSRMNRAG